MNPNDPRPAMAEKMQADWERELAEWRREDRNVWIATRLLWSVLAVWLVAVIVAFSATFAHGNPVPKQLPPAGAIDLNGECAFGAVSQVNRAITITGGTSWEATGRVRPSGFVELRWVDLSSGRFALGLYRIVDGKTLDGHYGYEGECQYDGEDFCGAIQAEVIRIMAK